ncbi:unnamed protein product [Ambrosiozyma monospora]|uniref:Unnamed protein product n=1 Tax=Ambrosiozyma monospora TaxID=43982 RepID=A0ACB5TVR4_AMBMO|nr:unnamed protein product [Ambrosiozyma monospora]
MTEEKQQVIDPTLDRRTLFVRSIPFDATNEELSDYFSNFSPVKHAVIVLDNEKNSRGFGFVSFSTDDDALTALNESKKAKFKDTRLLRVDIAKRRDRKKEDGKPAPVKKEADAAQKVMKKSARLIIRNLPWSVRHPNDLKKVFEKYGPVKDAHIPKGKGGRMSGFGFVTMSRHAVAQRVVKESVGLKIGDREVAVDFAVDKKSWEQHKEKEEEEESEEEADESDEDGDHDDNNEDKKEDEDVDVKLETEEDKKSDEEESDDEDDEDDIDTRKIHHFH